jgi:glucose-1-phosphate cytidylyltransferase
MNIEKTRVVLLAGGKGTRIREETDITPKPMIKVGKIPVIEHIMNRYIKFGLNNFLICTGYKSEVINNYFANYVTTRDFSINTSTNSVTPLSNLPNFNLEVIFTGNETETGGRIYKIRDKIEEDTFIVSYGDCLANVDIDKLINFHKNKNKIATITVTKLHSRFGFVELDDESLVNSFREKEKEKQLYSIGFMVFNKKIFDYLDDDVTLEKEPFTNLVNDEEIVAFEHEGFFEPMDTYREYLKLNKLWDSGNAPWE